MTRPTTSTRFRAALKRELAGWLADGLVDDTTAAALRERYRLDQLASESRRLLATVIFGIGALLVGGGVIAFVAANWEATPVPLKLLLLLAALLGLELGGWWLWQQRGMPRLGRALILGGCLVFGANIGLFAQIFQIHSDWYRGFGAWALGSLAMAWAVRSRSIGLLALVVSFFWFLGYGGDHPHALPLYPFLLAASVLPLAYLLRSASLHAFTLLALALAITIHTGSDSDAGWATALAALVVGLGAWAVGERHLDDPTHDRMAAPATWVGWLALIVTLHLLSFHDLVGELADTLEGYTWCLPVAATLLATGWLLAGPWSRASPRRVVAVVLTASFALAAAAVLLAAADSSSSIEALATALTNLAALGAAAAAVWSGIVSDRRGEFWLGSLYTVVLVLSRFFEFETSLLAKSAAFIACGVALIVAGIHYERHIKQPEVGHGT